MNFIIYFLYYCHFLATALAVKDYLFKNCQNSGFCHRNSHFAKQVRLSGDKYEPKFSIDASSITIGTDRFIVSGDILKQLPNLETRLFPFKLSLLEGNNIRFTIDEKRPETIDNVIIKHQRYNETEKWAFVNQDIPIVSNIESQNNGKQISFKYNDADYEYEAILQFYPIRLSVLIDGVPQFVVNGNNLLNIEHWRSEQDDSSNHLHPEESNYDLFHDSFADSKLDTVPLGPESIALDFTFKNFQYLYGIPEHADSLTLRDTTDIEPYRLFNVDIFEYDTDSRMAMYGSIPFLIASKPNLSIGLFWINSADTFINIVKSSQDSEAHWISENGVLDFVIIMDKRIDKINQKYGQITGYSKLPQLFSLGYHQSRWNYNDEKDVLDISETFDKHLIPFDTIWLDIEYAEKKKYFTWNKDAFPNPERMLKVLDRTARNLVVIIDPHMKTGYAISEELQEKKLTVNNNKNSTYFGHCWPGESVWIDTLNMQSRPVYSEKFTWGNTFLGGKSNNIHIWNDMNEPSVFNGPETSAPRDCIHSGDWEERSVHNIYGLSFHEATYEALKLRNEGHGRERPFVLTRAFYAGSQRTSAMWTGDNMCKWEHLQYSIPMILTLNVAGFPFAGADVGGFFGNPTVELLTRWFQAGIWYPFFRGHAHIDSNRREPWTTGEPYTSIIRDAIRLRYSLLPLIYTSFYETSIDGSPIMKPMFYETPENLQTYSIDDQFFVGNSGLLVKPITEENGDVVNIYIPDTEIYYDFSNGKVGESYSLSKPGNISKSVSLKDIPILIKGGSIITRKERYRRSSKLMYKDPYTLYIALNKEGKAFGKLYIDDGETFNYEKGHFIYIEFDADSNGISARVTGDNEYAKSIEEVVVEKIIILSSKKLSIEKVSISQETTWLGSISKTQDDKVITIQNTKVKINQSWKIDFEGPSIDHDEL